MSFASTGTVTLVSCRVDAVSGTVAVGGVKTTEAGFQLRAWCSGAFASTG